MNSALTLERALAVYQVKAGEKIRSRVSDFRFAYKNAADFRSAPTFQDFLARNHITIVEAQE
jgi:hypothetical protein